MRLADPFETALADLVPAYCPKCKRRLGEFDLRPGSVARIVCPSCRTPAAFLADPHPSTTTSRRSGTPGADISVRVLPRWIAMLLFAM